MTRAGVRAALESRDGPGCWYCGSVPGRRGEMTIDHFEPRRGKRGKPKLSELPNLRLCCDGCNIRKGDRPAAEFVADIAAGGRVTGRALAWLREHEAADARERAVIERARAFAEAHGGNDRVAALDAMFALAEAAAEAYGDRRGGDPAALWRAGSPPDAADGDAADAAGGWRARMDAATAVLDAAARAFAEAQHREWTAIAAGEPFGDLAFDRGLALSALVGAALDAHEDAAGQGRAAAEEGAAPETPGEDGEGTDGEAAAGRCPSCGRERGYTAAHGALPRRPGDPMPEDAVRALYGGDSETRHEDEAAADGRAPLLRGQAYGDAEMWARDAVRSMPGDLRVRLTHLAGASGASGADAALLAALDPQGAEADVIDDAWHRGYAARAALTGAQGGGGGPRLSAGQLRLLLVAEAAAPAIRGAGDGRPAHGREERADAAMHELAEAALAACPDMREADPPGEEDETETREREDTR